MRCVVEVACEDIDWIQNVEPNAEELAYRDNVIEHCLPNLDNCPSRQIEVLGAKKVLNCNWKNKRSVGHRCVKDEDGLPCCQTLAEVRDKIRIAVTTLLVAVLPSIPCISRWLSCIDCMGWWLLGKLCHNIFDRAFARAYPLAARLVQLVPNILTNDAADDDDDEAPNQDGWGQRGGREAPKSKGVKVRGGARSWSAELLTREGRAIGPGDLKRGAVCKRKARERGGGRRVGGPRWG